MCGRVRTCRNKRPISIMENPLILFTLVLLAFVRSVVFAFEQRARGFSASASGVQRVGRKKRAPSKVRSRVLSADVLDWFIFRFDRTDKPLIWCVTSAGRMNRREGPIRGGRVADVESERLVAKKRKRVIKNGHVHVLIPRCRH